jgi:hypothetical protein
MSSLFWDVHRRSQSTSSASDMTADSSLAGSRRAENAIAELEGRVDRLSMICCAMWTVIQAQSGVGDEELLKLVQELDLSDGEIDGKARLEQVQDCAVCHRPVARRHLRCLYCGATRRSSHPFEDVL